MLTAIGWDFPAAANGMKYSTATSMTISLIPMRREMTGASLPMGHPGMACRTRPRSHCLRTASLSSPAILATCEWKQLVGLNLQLCDNSQGKSVGEQQRRKQLSNGHSRCINDGP